MGTTANYALPYASTSDSPNGPSQQQALAEAVDAQLLRMDGTFDVQVFTSSGTWTKPANAKQVWVRAVGGGGAGGGAAATGASQWSFGDGGGSGEYGELWAAASTLGSTETVTIGAGGVGSSGAVGGSGGTTSFGAHMSCNGGGGGDVRGAGNTSNFSVNTAARTGGSGGSGGTIRLVGRPGGIGIGIGSTSAGVRAGDGGASVLGGGARESINAAANAGLNYGGGGGGTANSASTSARAGGNGAAGVVIVVTLF